MNFDSSNRPIQHPTVHVGTRAAVSLFRTGALVCGLLALVAASGCSANKDGVEGTDVGGAAGYNANGSQGGIHNNGNNNGTNNSGIPTAGCVVGSQGCYCDTIGGCSTGLACNTAGVCCDAASGNCAASTNTTTGSSTGNTTGNTTGTVTSGTTGTTTGTTTGNGTGTGTCTPGVTGAMVLDCGYPFTSSVLLTSVQFNESEVLSAIVPTGGSGAKVSVFYGDEHALTLGVRNVTVKSATGTTSTDYPVSAMTTNPSAMAYPQTGSNVLFGAQAGLDQSMRPMWPALFITDITNDPNNRAGDWQYGGKPFNPNAVYGTWKAAVRTVDTTVSPATVTITPDADPAKNNWDLGTGADPVPTTLKKNEGYGAEIVWYLALIPGHSYRVQAMVHDGDQNKVGGDSGEACVNFCAGNETYYPPDGGTHNPPDGGIQPPRCDEGTFFCGLNSTDPNYCPVNYLCANGCCIPNDSVSPILY